MEVSGTVIRQPVSFMRGSSETYCFSEKSRVRARHRIVAVAVRPWYDEEHRLYYASPQNCGVARDAKRKEKKKRDALLAALYSTGGEGILGEVRGDMIKEAAELLLAQLNQLKAKEKEMKKRKKEEKKALKVAKMRDCAEMSSSSSSSESSDTDCEDVVVMNKLRKNLQEEVKPNLLDVPDQLSECNHQAQSSPAVEADEKAEQSANKLKIETELISSTNCMNSTTIAIWNDSTIALGKPSDKIEVCMGGKCKKSGAIGLLQEFEKKVGIEGAVVGCKCMGKCKDGPNVRIVNRCGSKGELVDVVSEKPLCIGVGLEDVSAIVANFFGENNTDMNFVGA